ncbi:response regulator transcription factor [Clostridium sp. Marseille-P2415]|uniref:response regulator transcription factor n=1 Tax=Clostridium sp. Marseille-P2415 TaxID=1805471 RepID=UPI0009888C38|nr:response regulator [Clostridium sp. Marseille-P2415]
MKLIKVMIVDDEAIVRSGLHTCMDWNSSGFEVTVLKENGMAGLEYLKANPVDLIITDIKMPGMDGLEFIRQVRKAGYQAKFLILSGYDDFAYAQKALRYGAADYILKPIKEEELMNSLLRIRNEYFPEIQSSLIITPEKYSKTIKQILAYVDMNIDRPELSLKMIADDILFMSGSYISKLFLKETGYKFSTFLTIKRMEKAMLLIQANRDATVYEIAEQTGFGNNPQYFSTVFKKYYGKSPTELKL